MSAGIKGVSAGQDARYVNKEKKLMRTMKFPKEYELKVNLKLVNWEIMKVWIAQRITELLGIEDDVLIGYVFEQLDPEVHKTVDPRQLQIALTGFLEKNTSLFCKELWVMLHSAASNASGIPQPILDAKQEEVRQRELVQQELEVRLREAAAKREAEDREKRQAAAEADKEARRQHREAQESARRAADKERAAARDAARDRDRDRDRDAARDRDTIRDRDAARDRDGNRDNDGRRRSPDHRAHRGSAREHDQRHERKRSRSPGGEAEKRRRHQRRTHSPSPQRALPLLPRGGVKKEAPDKEQPTAAPLVNDHTAREGAADVAPVGSEDRERRHREKKEKKERKAQKKEKKRQKKEAQHKEAGGGGREGSPSSGSDGEEKPSPLEPAGDPPKNEVALEQLRQKALESVVMPAT